MDLSSFHFLFINRKRLRCFHKKKPKKPGSAGCFHNDMTAEHYVNIGILNHF